MSTIQNLFQQTQLAEAAYANFIDPQTNAVYSFTKGITDALIASGFSSDQGNPPQSAQATAFVADWSVVSQQTDAGSFSTTSGFSATLFKNNHTGQFSLAIRGSLQPVDFYQDTLLISTENNRGQTTVFQ